MVDRRLGLGRHQLWQKGNGPLRGRQRVLPVERCPVLEHLERKERVRVGNVLTQAEVDDVGRGTARLNDFPKRRHRLLPLICLALHLESDDDHVPSSSS